MSQFEAIDSLRKSVIFHLLRSPEMLRFRRLSRNGKPFIPPKLWTSLALDETIAHTLTRHRVFEFGVDSIKCLDPATLAQEVTAHYCQQRAEEE